MSAVDHLGEILAVIHGDGGHYTGEHGISKSVADAHATWAAVVRERDELRAQIAFLREEYGVNADSGTLTRDALEQKIQVLIDERRQLRARLVECRPWVGACPYPNTPGFNEVMAIRELADDTLEEVKP